MGEGGDGCWVLGVGDWVLGIGCWGSGRRMVLPDGVIPSGARDLRRLWVYFPSSRFPTEN